MLGPPYCCCGGGGPATTGGAAAPPPPPPCELLEYCAGGMNTPVPTACGGGAYIPICCGSGYDAIGTKPTLAWYIPSGCWYSPAAHHQHQVSSNACCYNFCYWSARGFQCTKEYIVRILYAKIIYSQRRFWHPKECVIQMISVETPTTFVTKPSSWGFERTINCVIWILIAEVIKSQS